MGKQSKQRQKEARRQKLRKLASHLTALEPGITDSFRCPVCPRVIPLLEEGSITDAHIVPKVAGGRASTFLCKGCNSTFGTRQDKWFGEHVRLAKELSPNIFDTRIQPKSFTIDDVPVHGSVWTDAAGNINFAVHLGRNPPAIDRLIREKFGSKPAMLRASFPFPIMRQGRMIDLGFLTAAYLAWFGAFGYSWALQSYLDPVREQILHPDKDIFRATMVRAQGRRWAGALGIVSTPAEVFLGFGVLDRMVLFPPIDRPTARLDADAKMDVMVRPVREVLTPEQPTGLVYATRSDTRVLIAPDAMLARRAPLVLLLYQSESERVDVLSRISDERWEALVRDPSSIHRKVQMRYPIPPLNGAVP